MSKKVFVTGAGASQPYTFPLGFDLAQQVRSQLVQHGGADVFDRPGRREAAIRQLTTHPKQ